MRGERDFEAYVAARGATVLRCLLALGAGLPRAEATAATAFAELRPHWWELADSADPDVGLWAMVLAVEARTRHRTHEAALQEDEVGRVLRRQAGLEEVQVCEILGISSAQLRRHLADQPDLPDGDDAEVTGVFPVPYARVRAAAARRRRRRWGAIVGVATSVVLVATGMSWLARPEPAQEPGDALEPVPARAEANPAAVVWWADGDLHLPTAVVRVGDVRRLVAADPGAAYVDARGSLVAVTPEGSRPLLGRLAEGSSLVSSPRLGLVAWVDASVDELTRLVVWDVEEGHEVAAVVTGPRVRPITFDGGWLRFGQGLRDWAWDPAGGPAQLTGDGYSTEISERTALVDAVAGTRLEQWGMFLRVARSGRRGNIAVPGFGGSLSSDGRFVLTGAEQHRQPRLYDARSGEEEDVWGAAVERLGAVFDDTGRVTWLAHESGAEGPVIATCGLTEPMTCSTAVRLGRATRVLLAGDSRR